MQISVVIPAFNEESYIGACLEHLTNQEDPADEIIVIDNNCEDDTAKIAKAYGARVIREKEQGMIPARNRGFEEARFDLIARCDADSRVKPDWIARIKKHFSKHKRTAALTGPIEYYDFHVKNITPIFKTYIQSVKLILGHYPLTGPNMTITKSLWNKVKNDVCLVDSEVHEDIDLSIHIDQVGAKIIYDKNLIVPISARRLKNEPASMLIEYPTRVVKTIKKHYSLYEKLNENLLRG